MKVEIGYFRHYNNLNVSLFVKLYQCNLPVDAFAKKPFLVIEASVLKTNFRYCPVEVKVLVALSPSWLRRHKVSVLFHSLVPSIPKEENT